MDLNFITTSHEDIIKVSSKISSGETNTSGRLRENRKIIEDKNRKINGVLAKRRSTLFHIDYRENFQMPSGPP